MPKLSVLYQKIPHLAIDRIQGIKTFTQQFVGKMLLKYEHLKTYKKTDPSRREAGRLGT